MPSAPDPIAARIAEYDDWRGETLSRIRALVKEADPDVIEELKWRKPTNPAGVPVWSHDGIICTGEAHTKHVRVTFANGASLDDPKGVFNSGLEGNKMRAIVLHESEWIDERAFKALVRAAVARNRARQTRIRGSRNRIRP